MITNQKIKDFADHPIILTLRDGMIGGLCGYTYARLAQLPGKQIAIATAILFIAEKIFDILTTHLSVKLNLRKSVKQIFNLNAVLISWFWLEQMVKHGLMGSKMAIVLRVTHLIISICIAHQYFLDKEEERKKTPATPTPSAQSPTPSPQPLKPDLAPKLKPLLKPRKTNRIHTLATINLNSRHSEISEEIEINE